MLGFKDIVNSARGLYQTLGKRFATLTEIITIIVENRDNNHCVVTALLKDRVPETCIAEAMPSGVGRHKGCHTAASQGPGEGR